MLVKEEEDKKETTEGKKEREKIKVRRGRREERKKNWVKLGEGEDQGLSQSTASAIIVSRPFALPSETSPFRSIEVIIDIAPRH